MTLPWATVETFPGADAERCQRWRTLLAAASDDHDRVVALVGVAISSYWSVQVGLDTRTWHEVADERRRLVDDAVERAERTGDPDLMATATLGRLYALWGPDHQLDRGPDLERARALLPAVTDEELRLRLREWLVVDQLDRGRLDAARAEIDAFVVEARGTGLVLFRRREQLWRANLAMLEGRLDDAVAINQEAVAATADIAGSPFSFQNVAITVAIERYLRQGLEEVVEVVRSIRASSPRVASGWDTGLAFTLSESGALDEAAELFDAIAADDFASVPRDLNWLPVTQLLGLVAVRLDDTERATRLLELLEPFAALDATHGSGYASYGPVGRVVALLAVAVNRPEEAERWWEHVLATRADGPWTSLTRLDRARATAAFDPDRALADAERAAAELARWDMGAWAAESAGIVEDLRLAGHGGPIARREGVTWVLRHPTGAATVAASRGMDHLVCLLARPGEAMPVTVLDTTVDPSLPASAAVQETLDPTARVAYRRRLSELEALTRPRSRDTEEMAFLRRELAGASYAPSSAEIERVRVRVTKAIKRALDAVADASPALGEHLAASVSTGRTCLYAPADGLAWTVVERD